LCHESDNGVPFAAFPPPRQKPRSPASKSA
jgi:hypothetical protein